MKLFFDARWIRLDFPDGVSRYTEELANAVARRDSKKEVTFILSDKRQLTHLPEGVRHIVFHAVDSPLEPFSSLLLNNYKPDVVFCPMQTMGSFGRRFKLILTLHDMTYYSHRTPPPSAKGIVRPLWRLYHATYLPQRLTLNAADMVATVSETSLHEITAAKLTKRPLFVVSNAARDLTPLLKNPVKQTAEPPKNLIFMSSPIPHKNPETLIRAMQWLPGRSLHILSKIKPDRLEELQKNVPEGADVVFHNGVTDEEYAKLLASNAIMVSASLSEGFGLPLAEALILGVPAVVSDRSYYHEVGGAAPLYVDPDDPEAFAIRVKSLDSLEERRKRAEIGKAYVKKFSWDNSANVLFQKMENLATK
jgi:glycosyltransferase involved in cell wall biosynthesis